jgi:hypothetical protein
MTDDFSAVKPFKGISNHLYIQFKYHEIFGQHYISKQLYRDKDCSIFLNKIDGMEIDGYDGFTGLFLVYFIYMQFYLKERHIKELFNWLVVENRVNLKKNLLTIPKINLLQFVYLTAFHRTLFGSWSNISERRKRLKSFIFILRDFYESSMPEYDSFYDDYFKYPIRVAVVAGSITSKTNKLLNINNNNNNNNNNNGKPFSLSDYQSLSAEHKRFLLTVFYSNYINPKQFIDIYPIIFHWDTYCKWARDLVKGTKLRIIIGESLNKLAPIIDYFDNSKKPNTYLVPFSKNIFKNETFTRVKDEMKPFINLKHLEKYKMLLDNQCGLTETILNDAKTITIMDYVESGNGFVSFVTLFLLMFPHLKPKIRCKVVGGYIPELKESQIYFQKHGPHKWEFIKNKISSLLSIPLQFIVYKCNRYVFDVFTQEYFENRLFILLPIENVSSPNMNIYYQYDSDKINLNRLVRFYIFDRLFKMK